MFCFLINDKIILRIETNESYKDENNNDGEKNEKSNIDDETSNQKTIVKSKSTDSIAIRKRELEKKNKKNEPLLKNSIKDLRNCYDNSLSSSKSQAKKKTTKTMKKSNSSLLASSILNSSSTTLTRNSSYEPDKDELKRKNNVKTPNDKKKTTMKKPINYLRSNSKSALNTKSRYMLSSNSSNKIRRKEKSAGDDVKVNNKRKGNMNVSLPLSISIPYSSVKKTNKPSSREQKLRNTDSAVDRKSISSKGKSERKKMKSIPLNISLSVSAPTIDNISDENLSSNNSTLEDGFDSSYCNNSFNNYDHNLPNDIQYCNPDNENEDNESNIKNKKNYIIENIIVNHENEQIFSPPSKFKEEKESNIEVENTIQNIESESELQKQDFFSNLGHNKMNYSSSETDKMYYYSINDNDDDKTIYYKNYDQDKENKENNNQNKKMINKNINNIIQKSKKKLLKKTSNNADMWSIKSEPIDYSENENKKTNVYQKSILKKTQNTNYIANDEYVSIRY